MTTFFFIIPDGISNIRRLQVPITSAYHARLSRRTGVLPSIQWTFNALPIPYSAWKAPESQPRVVSLMSPIQVIHTPRC